MKEKFAKFLGALKEGFTPMTIELMAGKGTDSDGNLIEGTAFEMSMKEDDTKGTDEFAKPVDTSGTGRLN